MNDERTTLEDTINLNNPAFERNRTFESFNELFKNQVDKKVYHRGEQDTKRIAHYAVKRFWELVIEDLIFRNIEFVFPWKVLYFSIRARKFSSKAYKYNIDTGGLDIIPYVTIGKHKMNILRRLFLLKLSKKYRNLLQKEIKRGHLYSMAPEKFYRE